MEIFRSYGILLHPTSLPGPWGIGVLGDGAYRFIEWLQEAGASWWQMLPLGVTGYGDSPYQSFSAFAGNPYLIDPEQIFLNGWMDREAPPPVFASTNSNVDYGEIYSWKWSFLRRAYNSFCTRASQSELDDFSQWCESEKTWLEDYALFMSLKDQFQGAPWSRWPMELRNRNTESLQRAHLEQAENIRFHSWTQWLFHEQWSLLKEKASQHNISLVGDMPIFVSHDSADVWAHPGYFLLDEHGNPSSVAGVPPDYFSETGQRWGNPLYNWKALEENNFSWWVARVKHALRLTDLIRIDHFRGFEAYWEIPATEATAIKGQWVKAPGEKLFQVIQDKLGSAPIIAEDLGMITPEVEKLRDHFQFPGMKVLQFAFEGDESSPFLPHNYPANGNCLVYTGTHDNDTTLGWYRKAASKERQFVNSYLDLWDLGSHPMMDENFGANWRGSDALTANKRDIAADNNPSSTITGTGITQQDAIKALAGGPHSLESQKTENVCNAIESSRADNEILWSIIALAFMSPSKMAIIPLQDALGLDNQARMNVPSKVGGNWTWRVLQDQLNTPTAQHLRKLAERTARIPHIFPAVEDNRFTKLF